MSSPDGRRGFPLGSKGSDAYRSWIETKVAAIAQDFGLTGRGPVFRKRDGEVWTVFALERRRMDPWEAVASATDRVVDFRVMVGFAIPAIRPAWDTRKGPPGMHDFTMYAPTPVLEPPDGEPWHVFDSEDSASHERLTEFIRAGLPSALESLGPPDPRAILDAKVAYAGPLENLSPGAAEELLALSDLASADDVRIDISEALGRPRVPDPDRDRFLADVLDSSADIFGPGVRVEVMWPPRDDEIHPPISGRRRTGKVRTRLIADLDADRLEVRRLSASALGAWVGDDEVIRALRRALDNDDEYTGACAARSLGHLGDADQSTWSRALEMAATTSTAPTEVAEAIVLLNRLDTEGRSRKAARVVGEMCIRFPADTRRLAALAALIDTSASA